MENELRKLAAAMRDMSDMVGDHHWRAAKAIEELQALKSKPINIGDLDPQQRLDVARGESAEPKTFIYPGNQAVKHVIEVLKRHERIAELEAELAQRDAEIGRLNKRVVALEAGPLPRGWREVIDQARESIGAGAPGEYAQTERAAVEPYLDGLYDEFDALESQQAASVGGELVGWQFYQDGKWSFGSEHHNHRGNTEQAGIPTRNVYAALSPAGGGVVTAENIEMAAQLIYTQWDAVAGYVPWVKGGNSIQQDYARKLARELLARLNAKPQANSQEAEDA